MAFLVSVRFVVEVFWLRWIQSIWVLFDCEMGFGAWWVVLLLLGVIVLLSGWWVFAIVEVIASL